jgi:hypothetical protein
MDLLGWLGWGLLKLVGLIWSLVWFLLGGWVATLAQLAIIVGVIFSYKYGWRRAPAEILSRTRGFSGFVWAWMRARDYSPAATPQRSAANETRLVKRRRRKEFGDVNISTLLSVVAIAGLGLVAIS